MKFSPKIYEIPRAVAARVRCAIFVPVKFTVPGTSTRSTFEHVATRSKVHVQLYLSLECREIPLERYSCSRVLEYYLCNTRCFKMYRLLRNALRLLKLLNHMRILSGAGAHCESATSDVWVKAFGGELLFLLF